MAKNIYDLNAETLREELRGLRHRLIVARTQIDTVIRATASLEPIREALTRDIDLTIFLESKTHQIESPDEEKAPKTIFIPVESSGEEKAPKTIFIPVTTYVSEETPQKTITIVITNQTGHNVAEDRSFDNQ